MKMSSITADEMVEKTREVMDWLKTFYTDVPPFDINEKSIGTLLKMKKASEDSAKQVALIIDDAELKTEEYQAESERIGDVINHVGLSPDCLSSECQSMIKNLALAACSLELKQPSRTSFLLALSNATQELNKLQGEKTDEERVVKQLNNTTIQTWVKVQHLRNLQPMINEERKTNKHQRKKLEQVSAFLKTKIKNYMQDISQLEDEYRGRKMEENLTHQALEAKLESVKKSKTELASIEEKVNNYYELPANCELATVRLTQLRKQLEEVTKRIFEEIPENDANKN